MKNLLLICSCFLSINAVATDCRMEALMLEKAQLALEDHTQLVSTFNQNFAYYIRSYGVHLKASIGKKIAPSLGANLIDSANNFKTQIDQAEQNNKLYVRAVAKAQKEMENCLTKYKD
jgi:hypothetical protein